METTVEYLLKIIKTNYKDFCDKIDSLKKFNFVMTLIIHKMSTLLKNHLNDFKDNVS